MRPNEAEEEEEDDDAKKGPGWLHRWWSQLAVHYQPELIERSLSLLSYVFQIFPVLSNHRTDESIGCPFCSFFPG